MAEHILHLMCGWVAPNIDDNKYNMRIHIGSYDVELHPGIVVTGLSLNTEQFLGVQ